MTKFNKIILLVLIMLLVFGILVVFIFDINCFFKTVFSIPCPGCGLTRGFREIIQGNLIGSFNYNILALPLFLFIFWLFLLFIIDILKQTNYCEKYLLFFKKYYVVLIMLVISSFIINLIRNI